MAANTITRGRLRRLAELRPDHGRVLSIFYNLDPREFATPGARATEATSVLTAAGHRIDEADDLEQRERSELHADLGRVAGLLRGGDVAANGARGLAVYACGAVGLLEVVRLPHPVESGAILDHSPVVAPLVRAASEDRWCVLLVNRRTARIFTGATAELDEVGRIDDDTHSQHDQGGWSQKRFERSIEQEKLNHVDRALAALFERFKAQPFDHLLVGAPEELVGEVEQRLHPYLRERLAGRLTLEIEGATAADVRGAAAAVAGRHLVERERRALDRLAEGLGRGDRAAAGIADVLAALEQGRVRCLLVVEGADRPEAVEDAIEQAITQSAEVIVVRRHDQMSDHGGIGAILRF